MTFRSGEASRIVIGNLALVQSQVKYKKGRILQSKTKQNAFDLHTILQKTMLQRLVRFLSFFLKVINWHARTGQSQTNTYRLPKTSRSVQAKLDQVKIQLRVEVAVT